MRDPRRQPDGEGPEYQQVERKPRSFTRDQSAHAAHDCRGDSSKPGRMTIHFVSITPRSAAGKSAAGKARGQPTMSRAFVKDGEDAFDEPADRPISPHQNLVTPEGLAAIEATLSRLHEDYAAAQ